MMTTYKRESGFVLPYALGITLLIVMIAASYFTVVMTDLLRACRTADLIRAYYVADAGLANAFTQLTYNQNQAFPITSSYSVASGSLAGSYNVQKQGPQLAADGTYHYTLTSHGTYNGITKTLVLQLQTISFSSWGYISNTEIDPVWGGNWYITGMITTGPAHTNGQFNMYGTPLFEGAVSQVASAVHYWIGPPFDNPDFEKGLTVNAPVVSLPKTNQFLNSISTAARQTQGVYLSGNSTITFVQDGTINVTNTAKNWTNKNMPLPANNALFVHGTATVQGVLKGRLTIGSDQDIVIGGSIVYQTDPRTNPSSTDLLGLVARNKVTVTDRGPYNIEVDGSIVALGNPNNMGNTGQFWVKNFWTFLKGDMVQFGGLSTNLPGGLTGIFNPWTGQIVAGYNQLQYFDTRLMNQAPPWFPPAMYADGRTIYRKVSISEI